MSHSTSFGRSDSPSRVYMPEGRFSRAAGTVVPSTKSFSGSHQQPTAQTSDLLPSVTLTLEMSGPKDGAAQGNMEVTTQRLTESAPPSSQPIPRVTRNKSGPMRSVTRNRSGPLQRGVARNRSGPMRGVSRNKSGGLRWGGNHTPNRTRALPLKTNSFHRSVPDRASSTSSLRKFRRQQNGLPVDNDASVTSAQTKDSILVRKSQIGGDVPELRERRWEEGSSITSGSMDDISLHTMDSMAFHRKHIEEGGPDDISAFSESFISSSTYMDDDYQDDLDEDGELPESDQRVAIEMNNLTIQSNENSFSEEEEEEEEEDGEEELK
eukprot:scaffold22715_cov128-Cylindrotheca_fusiformis.AAC.4